MAKNKCFSCGVEKDLSTSATYPYEEDNITTDSPVAQLFTVECEGDNGKGDRMAVLCHECWHHLESNGGIDMWIGQRCWESLNPVIPFERLPKIILDWTEGKWDAGNYTPLAFCPVQNYLR